MLRKELYYCYLTDGQTEVFYCTPDARVAFKYTYSCTRRLSCIFPSSMLLSPVMNFAVFKGYKPCYNFNVKMSGFTMNPPAGTTAKPVYFSDTFLDYFKYFSNDENPMPLVMEPVHLMHQTDGTVLRRLEHINCTLVQYTTMSDVYENKRVDITPDEKKEVSQLFNTLNLIWYTRGANNG